MTTPTQQIIATELHSSLKRVDLAKVPVQTLVRQIPRLSQAKLARQLFRKLGLKGISVTTPRYSMASTVEVSLPRREDYKLNSAAQVEDYATDPAAVANQEAIKQVSAILLAAFPNHNDRSDYRTDYFDSKWSIN